ncbi:hypothetical protein Back2_25290 [Nocardioides baekrokdamisoli]|uniref:Galactose oxidase n=1 Tax=Nocardioides baekrokdamisoli TaxID=1804624 RepID=A0A3G9IJ92_9ACTN|nr:hypothetical protein [Nocardioides baekrokdamisoli]BBH18242.1 hypothetical protein Back2_25290 [Nocardioides baekrokdamisoli]
MRRALAVAALATLTACGSTAAQSTPTTGGSSVGSSVLPIPVTLAHPIVDVMPYRLVTGVGREAIIQTPSGAIIAGGLVVGDTTTDAAQEIDLGAGKVTSLPALKVPVHDTAGSQNAAGPLVIGGGNSSEQSVVQQWSGGAWSVVGHLPTTRSDLVAVSTGGRTFVLGGYDAVTPAVSSVVSSSDGRTWTTVGSLVVPLRYAATAVFGAKVWLFGGEASGAESNVVQTFDTATGKGQVVAHLPMAIGHASAFRFQDKVLILGGRTDASSGAMTDQMWWFDPATDKFADAGKLPYVLADAAIVTGGNFAYVVGGESPHPISTILRITFTKER